ncbi:hypothetical protein LOTGIDRAFT_190816 [Lottia gigantea]|uniref:Protein disulfide-isomerase n=1 Tax=Lottia gigantea TaxID=225164 RepID=V4A6R2_LOTGI|nr:hypothetical protein LOTGIDRAFT_190816 [Lottia gigantea]ESO92392.1 hypothetical protein LOTGIDRAFT_190816 [Lottia gigantea]
MKSLVFLISVFVASIAADDVLVFTDSDFSTKASEHDLALIEFYAPWCGHCKKLAPEYEKAASTLKSNDPPVALAKVDCTVEKDVCSKYGVSGYPTLKIFRNGEFSEDYNGPREAGGIVKLMKSKAGPTSTLLETLEQAEKIAKSSEYAAIGFFKSLDSELGKTFQKVADAISGDLKFAHTENADIMKKFGFKDKIVLFRPKKFQSKFEDHQLEYKDDSKLHTLKNWVQENILGLCSHRTPDNADKLKKPLFVAYYDVDYVKNEKGTNYWRNRVMKVGKKLRDAGKNLYFGVSNSGEFAHEMSECGLNSQGDKPKVCAWDSRDRKFAMSEEFSMETFEKFINDVLEGKLEPYLKSEPIPDNTDVPVKTVVAKNFEEIVNDENKDVLIEFYAPWCGHCKSLAPKYEELAEALKDEKEITIAKMDATANDVSKPYDVTGFPTLYFVPKDKKDNPVKYNGGREVGDFIKYLAKEATNELSGYKRNGKKKKTEL